jgi:F0F1-type ATP synthase alpha subunit
MRIDLLKPLTKGNLILFKGDRNIGKTSLAISIIKNFLEKSGPDAKVVYVGMSQKGKELKETIKNQNLLTIGVEDESQAAYVFAPNLGLRVATEQSNCLLVFDDVLLHQMKERLVYDIADQPFSPINIINEIAS